MTTNCTNTPYETNNSPYSKKNGNFRNKNNVYSKKDPLFVKKDDVYTKDHFCPILLQENKYPLLLENAIMIRI